jgi:ferrous iron transport protein A
MSLNQVLAGHTATITEIHASEYLRHRMTALGLRRGRRVLVIRRARYEGPLHVRVGMTEVMLRRADAATVEVVVNGD